MASSSGSEVYRGDAEQNARIWARKLSAARQSSLVTQLGFHSSPSSFILSTTTPRMERVCRSGAPIACWLSVSPEAQKVPRQMWTQGLLTGSRQSGAHEASAGSTHSGPPTEGNGILACWQ